MNTLPDIGPVMVASGCGGTGRELAAYAELAGLCFVTRSITLNRRPGVVEPRIAETPSGWVHAGGAANPGLETFLATELPALVRAGARVFVSIVGSSLLEYADLARRLSNAPGIAGLEVNVGSPTQIEDGLFEVREPYHASSVVAAVRREFPAELPVLAKLRPDVTRAVEGARGVLDAGATAVVVGNAVPALMPDGRAAGLSGPAILPVSLRCASEVLAALPDASVVGGGGVATSADARRYLDAGCLGVQVGTALLHDPTTLTRIRDDLSDQQGDVHDLR